MPNIHLETFGGSVLSVLQMPTLKCIGRCDGMREYGVSPHVHSCTEVVYIVRGRGSVVTEGAEYPLSPGTVAIYPPQTTHHERLTGGGENVLFYHIKLDGFMLSGLPMDRLLPGGSVPVMAAGDEGQPLEALFGSLFLEAEKRLLGYRQVADKLTSAIFLILLRIVSGHNIHLPISDGDSVVFSAQQYITARYQQQLTVRLLAAQCHVDSCYLSHLFKKTLGVSPLQYINAFRVNAAGRLLQTTDMSVQEISQTVGYENLNHFYAQFRKYRDETPMEYRRRCIVTSYIDRREDGCEPLLTKEAGPPNK